VRELRRFVRVEIARLIGDVIRPGRPDRVVATSKTFRQLGRIAGAAPSSEGPLVPRSLRREDLAAWVPKLAEMPAEQRARLPGVSQGRARQLLAGAVVADACLDLLEVDAVELCPWALREGIILRRLDKML
jgi:exopolyphosphatase/guanosine-5'-triphosphate,3'-diphosphate pyrophosphatase